MALQKLEKTLSRFLVPKDASWQTVIKLVIREA